MLIRVRYQDNSYDMVKAWRLDEYITTGKIVAFYRSDGWVTVGSDQLRHAKGNYTGPERRRKENNIPQAA